MNIDQIRHALKFRVAMTLRTPLLLSTGREDEFTDDTIEMTPDLRDINDEDDQPRLHINGYVWASLIRRSLSRLKTGKALADTIGKYRNDELKGVSPLWCDATFAGLCKTDINAGNKIDRKYGAASTGGLYSKEIFPAGHRIDLHFLYFCENDSSPDEIRDILLAALWIIDEGIEGIGGGWSYGHGRLQVNSVACKTLDLYLPDHRKELWVNDFTDRSTDVNWIEKKEHFAKSDIGIDKSWIKYVVDAGICQGQLLAIHTQSPPLDVSSYEKFPDTFVFVQTVVDEKGRPEQVPAITGKAFRQAVLSSSIERKLRTKGETICLDTTKSKNCACKRCLWFGSTAQGGIVSVAHALVKNPHKTEINRISLCEHSLQNINLFAGEYLTGGTFRFEILVDISKAETCDELTKEIDKLLEEMKPGANAPPGWYRLGATSTCTGQIEINGWSRKYFGGSNANE